MEKLTIEQRLERLERRLGLSPDLPSPPTTVYPPVGPGTSQGRQGESKRDGTDVTQEKSED